MVVAEEDRKNRHEGRAEVYKWIELSGRSEETIPRNSVSRNRSEGNSKRDHDRTHRSNEENLLTA